MPAKRPYQNILVILSERFVNVLVGAAVDRPASGFWVATSQTLQLDEPARIEKCIISEPDNVTCISLSEHPLRAIG
jgi:hypothetical protein